MIDHTAVAAGLHYQRIYTEDELLLVILNTLFAQNAHHLDGEKLSRFRVLRARKCQQILQRLVIGEHVREVEGGYMRTDRNRPMTHFPYGGEWHVVPTAEYDDYVALLRKQSPEGQREERIAELERQLHELKENHNA